MATRTTAFAALAFAGCATTSEPTPPYDEIARTLGDQLVGERIALANVTRIAHGGNPDAAIASYDVRCFDAVGKRITCGPWTVTATATAVWGGPDYFRDAMWTLRGIDDELGLVTGDFWAVDGQRMTYKTGTQLYDLGELQLKAGAQFATIDDELAATIRFERYPLVTITLDDRDYWLAPDGTVTAATQLE
jgi:hypothetical protein